jgi:hypothetical protein
MLVLLFSCSYADDSYGKMRGEGTITEMPRRGGWREGADWVPVSVQTLQSLTVSKTKEASSAENRSHSPGMP